MPTRSCWPPDRSTRACSRCSACPRSRRRSPATAGRVVHVANLRADAETAGLDGTDQLRALLDHGRRIDVLLHDPQHGLAVSETDSGNWG